MPADLEVLAVERFRYWVGRGHRPGLAAKLANLDTGAALTSAQYQKLTPGLRPGCEANSAGREGFS